MDRLGALLILSCSLSMIIDIGLADTFDVTEFGALGNGNDDDSKAFLNVWSKACASKNNATIVVPEGRTFLLNPLQFVGPCKGKSIEVQIDGTLVAPSSPSEWSDCTENTWIVFSDVEFLRVYGNGKLDGQGSSWWKKLDTNHDYEINADENKYHHRKGSTKKGGSCTRPTGLRFKSCNNLELRGLTHVDSPSRHVNIFQSNHVQISSLTITAPEESPNTDGIGISYSTDVNIVNSIIGTGDDCIAITTGSSNIFVGGVQCGPGHGISVGSLGEGGSSAAVDGVYVKNCSFTGTTNGARIKTWQGGKGYARNITYDDIRFDRVKNCIIIDQNYCDEEKKCSNKGDTAVELSDVKYLNVRGTSSIKQAILLECSSLVPCKHIVLDRVNITSTSDGNDVFSTCKNAEVSSTTVSPSITCE